MNPLPNAQGGGALALGQRPAPVAEVGVESGPSHYGAAHAVPVREAVASSGRLAEAVYRGFEIVVASVGLALGLPVMVVVAFLIRCDSPGPALFFHKRPARSIIVRRPRPRRSSRPAAAAGRLRGGRPRITCRAISRW